MDFSTILDTLKKIDWAISLLASIPLSILANALTPKLLSWKARRSLERRTSRASELTAELDAIRRLRDDPAALAIENSVALFRTLFLLGIGSALAAFPIVDIITGPSAALFFTMSMLSASKQYQVLRRIQGFEQFEKSIAEQIAALNAA
jgi:hypothetical protein